MKVSLVQFNPIIGDFDGNARRIIKHIQTEKKYKTDLIIFPELVLSGYPPKDLIYFNHAIKKNKTALLKIAKFCDSATVICGFVEKNKNPLGAPFYNSAAIISNKKVKKIYRKQLLPSYDVFDEKRYFEPGSEKVIFKVGGKKIAITICEDAWYFEKNLRRSYLKNPLKLLIGQDIDYVVNLSASPFYVGKPELREKIFSKAARYLGKPFFVCNQVGGNDELIFDGSSFIISNSGKILVHGKTFEEDVVRFDTEKPLFRKTPPRFSDGEQLFNALKLGLADYFRKSSISSACLGISGGIDSAVTAAIAAYALNNSSVIGVMLQSRYTSKISLEDSKTLASNLGIEFLSLSIEPFLELFENMWMLWFGKKESSLTKENIQSRLRMAILMAIANERGAALLNTSNKSEIACGYATLYGDSAGALSVIGDLTKKEVLEIAHFINRDREIIPKRILLRPPSAELKHNQKDEDVLPPYSILDEMVKLVIEKKCGPSELKKMGFQQKWINIFVKLHSKSEYKRYQLPPVLRVSTTCFGKGRLPIAAKGIF